MSHPPVCPICQSALPPCAPEGLCPRCLWASLLEPEDEEQEAGLTPLATPPGRESGILRDYELLNEIARGGMGVVYRARQTSLNRIVALKMIINMRLPGEAAMRRFRAEAEAVASLEHAHIVPIYDVGEDDGRPYFTMKFVAGGSLAGARPKPEGATLRASILLMAKVAHAVHHAHQRGILHRDLKPSNILLDDQGEPLITDFGLAQYTERESDLTLSGTVLGTPAYIAPEQATGGQHLTTAVDVYSLGAILYELLAGRPPFSGAGMMDVLHKVMQEEPARPSGDRDLQTICLKCLEKKPAARYSSAGALAEDLERWLRQEPILARPITPTERVVKWVRRYPARAALVGVGLLAPAVIIVVLLVTGAEVRRERNSALQHDQRATREAARAEASKQDAVGARDRDRQNLYAADILLAQHALDDGNLTLARSLLSGYQPANVSQTNSIHTTATDLRGFEWRLLWERSHGDPHQTLHGHSNAVQSVAFSPDSRLLASADAAGQIRLWEGPNHHPGATWQASDRPIVHLTISANAGALATADNLGRVRVWNVATHALVWEHEGRNPEGVQLSPTQPWIGVTDGTEMVETNSVARVVEWTTGKEILHVPVGDFEGFSKDGELAFITRRQGQGAELWELKTGKVIWTLRDYNGSLVVSPDGRHFAGRWPERGGIFLADMSGAVPPTVLMARFAARLSLCFSADGALLATVGSDQTVRLWDVTTQREVDRLWGHGGEIHGVAFSPDGKTMATASSDQTVVIWPTRRKVEADSITNSMPPYVLSPDGSKLAGMSWSVEGGNLRLTVWDLPTHHATLLGPAEGAPRPQFFSDDNSTLFTRSEPPPQGALPLLRWDLDAPTNPPTTTLLPSPGTNAFEGAAATPDGRIYALSRIGTEGITLWQPFTGKLLGELHSPTAEWLGMPCRFSPDGLRLVSCAYPNQLRISDLTEPGKVVAAAFPAPFVRRMSYSPDGKFLAVAGEDQSIHLLDTATLQELGLLQGHQQVVAVAFSPDGRTLASAGRGGVVKLWCWPARREVATLTQTLPDLCFVAFTPDGNTLIAGGWGPLGIFHVPSLAEIDRNP